MIGPFSIPNSSNDNHTSTISSNSNTSCVLSIVDHVEQKQNNFDDIPTIDAPCINMGGKSSSSQQLSIKRRYHVDSDSKFKGDFLTQTEHSSLGNTTMGHIDINIRDMHHHNTDSNIPKLTHCDVVNISNTSSETLIHPHNPTSMFELWDNQQPLPVTNHVTSSIDPLYHHTNPDEDNIDHIILIPEIIRPRNESPYEYYTVYK